MSDKSTVKALIEDHKMTPHPEGGHYVEIFRNMPLLLQIMAWHQSLVVNL